ncbi:glycosyltransferase [Nocardioides pantholopis]|uniref:glycosyltransferase n=1 Tax=Nocardioides pantholopis TaxID=2483798 RepID=UPI001F14FE83|nr:glycosyltransferase [Nocardioides pantholopis]
MTSGLKIALVSEHADPLAALGGADAGGQNVHVAALAAGLARRGHEVVVHTRRTDPDAPATVRAPGGYLVDRVTAGPAAELAKDELLPYVPRLGEGLAERWAADPVDVVHAHFWMSGLAALRGVAGAGVPVVQTFHALGSVKRRHQGEADTSPPERIEQEARLCAEVDRVIATCTDEVGELERLGLAPGRASVIPCGVDTRQFRPGPGRVSPQGRHRVLVIGRMVPRKGVDTVIEAVADLPEVELVIAGGPPPARLAEDPHLRALCALAQRAGVAHRTRFLGGVAQRDVAALIRGCSVVATVPWYEPFGITPLEAMACGRPVVGSAVGGLLDTVVPGRTGELVPPRDPVALAAALRELLADPARRAAYGEEGRRRAVAHYDWDQVVRRTEEVYRGLARPVPARQDRSSEEVAR